MLKSLAYIGILSPSCAKWEEQGSEIYGFELMPRGPDGSVRFRLDDCNHRISIHPAEKDDLGYLGWDVGGPAELERAADKLSGLGFDVCRADPELAAERCVGDLLWFLDPLGFRHELIWGQMTAPGTFRSGRGVSGFVTGNMGLGHVVLIVPDLSYESFLTDVLGFRITDQLVGHTHVRFFHTNPRHHSLGFAVAPGRVGLHHMMVEVKAMEDVGIAYDMALARGIPMANSLGHHGNDRTLSFYARSPSGFELEYGWGSRTVDDETWVVETYDRTSIWGHHLPETGRIPSEIEREYIIQEQ